LLRLVIASAVASWHRVLHAVCGITAFIAMVAVCSVFTRRFAASGRRGLAIPRDTLSHSPTSRLRPVWLTRRLFAAVRLAG
jgi:hypothetical protein